MGENEYKDGGKVLYKTRIKLTLPHKKLQEAECFVTGDHVVIEAEEPIRIPLSRVKECYAPSPSYRDSIQYREPLSVIATLTFIDSLNKKRSITLEGPVADIHSFKKVIEVKGLQWLLESLKNIGIQNEFVNGVTVKLIGQNIDEIKLVYRTRDRPSSWWTEDYLAGLIYIVQIPSLRKGRGLYAETYVDAMGLRWVGGALAYYLNEDSELAKLLEGAKETDIRIKAHKKPDRVAITVPQSTPTKKDFEILDRIATHIREVATEAVATGVASSRERLGTRVSILHQVNKFFKSHRSLAGFLLGFFGIVPSVLMGVVGAILMSEGKAVWGIVLIVPAVLLFALVLHLQIKYDINLLPF